VTPASNANFNQIASLQTSPATYYYPAARLVTQMEQPAVTQADFPGSAFANQIAGNKTRNFTGSYGFDFTVMPKLINQFKAGFLYNAAIYAYDAAPLYVSQPSVAWNYPGASGLMSGQQYNLPITTYYPIFNFSDSMSWQKESHNIQYGVSWYREQDQYWNARAGFNNYNLGLAAGDPVHYAPHESSHRSLHRHYRRPQ
jgi:hypothetical protein